MENRIERLKLKTSIYLYFLFYYIWKFPLDKDMDMSMIPPALGSTLLLQFTYFITVVTRLFLSSSLVLFLHNVWLSLSLHYFQPIGVRPTSRAANEPSVFTIMEKALLGLSPEPTSTFTFKTLLRPWNNGKEGPRLVLTSLTTTGQQIHHGRLHPDSKYDKSVWLVGCPHSLVW